MAPSRVKHRKKKDARLQGPIVKHKKREVKPRCSVCMTIIKVVKEAFISAQDLSLDLGTFKSVMVSTTCKVHPQLFHRRFRTKIDTESVKRFSVDYFVWGGIFINAHFKVGSGGNNWFQMKFLPMSSREDTHFISKIVDPLWIDHNLLRRWKRDCDSRNNPICHVGLANAQLSHNRPAWLIDTWRLCLTPGDNQAPYVALSYVWGQTTFFKTCKANIDELQMDMALLDSHRRLGVPRTIADTISLVGLLEERYLWVDALCIVQDDQSMKHDQINNMGSIFANATVTIIAKGGEHANHGLRGLRGTSEPRSISQEVTRLGKSYSVVSTPAINSYMNHRTWDNRGWTLQEQLFSRRLLFWDGDSVRWYCACSTFSEFHGKLNVRLGDPGAYDILTLNSLPAFPDLDRYQSLAAKYNSRDLSYPGDALPAFAGIASMLSNSFYGGFICALPVLFFDIALLWQPFCHFTRRGGSNPSTGTDLGLPSWSWVAGKGTLQVRSEMGYFKASQGVRWPVWIRSNQEIVPMVQWHSRSCITSIPHPIRAPWELHELRERSLQGLGDVPKGWTRFDYRGDRKHKDMRHFDPVIPQRYFYKHESDPTTEFWYPIPLCSPERVPTQNYDRLLSCRTHRAWLSLSDPIWCEPKRIYDCFVIRDAQGKWAGTLRPDDVLPEDQPQLGTPFSGYVKNLRCELVVISRGYSYEGYAAPNMYEWAFKERPKAGAKGSKYEYYNVLWVEWEEGIAYRKGVGRVEKAAWEAQELEWIDLILG